MAQERQSGSVFLLSPGGEKGSCERMQIKRIKYTGRRTPECCRIVCRDSSYLELYINGKRAHRRSNRSFLEWCFYVPHVLRRR
jgi:hypothetical protein